MLYDANPGDFKVIVTGDSIITRSLSAFREPGFLAMVECLHDSDVTVTNAEMLFHNYEDPPGRSGGWNLYARRPSVDQGPPVSGGANGRLREQSCVRLW